MRTILQLTIEGHSFCSCKLRDTYGVCVMCVCHVCVSSVCVMCVYHVCVLCVCVMCVCHVCVSCVCVMCVCHVCVMCVCQDLVYEYRGLIGYTGLFWLCIQVSFGCIYVSSCVEDSLGRIYRIHCSILHVCRHTHDTHPSTAVYTLRTPSDFVEYTSFLAVYTGLFWLYIRLFYYSNIADKCVRYGLRRIHVSFGCVYVFFARMNVS